jgi:uncharacterized membrane protein
MKIKPVITYGLSGLLIVGLIILFYRALPGVSQPVSSTESFNEALWGTWGVTIIIVAFIIFAGGTGILVLLGGGWRWE